MASGGHYPYRGASTDPRPRAAWQRTTSNSDKDDNISNHSNPNELRPNNWDFSDWKPKAPIDNTKRRKKGNPEREREKSLGQDSPPPSERAQRTPSTYPRTRITPSTPTSQRIALENLRQQLTFSDQEDQVSNDGEKNNERNVPTRRGHLPNFTRQDMSRSSEEISLPREIGARRARSMVANNNTDGQQPTLEGTDGGQIVGRLMQIRDYIKQAKSMMDALKKSGSPQTHGEDVGKLQKLLENLQEQERAYLALLQQLLSVKEESVAILDSVNQRDQTPRPESAEDTQSIDLDVRSETSEATTANTEDVLYNHLNQGRSNSGARPRIEDKLGVLDDDDQTGTSPTSEPMESTLVQRPEWDFEDEDLSNANLFVSGQEGESLQALQLQEKLLKKLKEQQEQMRALKGRQASLLAIQRDAERKLAEARAWSNQAQASGGSLNTAPGNIPLEADMQSRSDAASDIPSREDFRQHRNYLRNEFKEQNTDTAERQSNPEVEAASVALEDNRRQLEDKLRELQEKKQKMDSLLHELNGLRNERYDVITQLNNATANSVQEISPPERPPVASSSAQRINAGVVALAEADQTTAEAQELQSILEARDKLEKLQEVKERLNQLRSLVQYYQTSTAAGEIPEIDERTAFQNMIEGYGQGLPPQNIRAAGASGTIPDQQPSTQSKSDEDNRSESDSSETDSKLSSLGPWGDDPEIQEKVRKLKAAKEKLKQLQDIVCMVQHSPDAAEALPDNITELAANIEGTQFSEDRNVSASKGEGVPAQVERDSFYEAKMQEQLQELEQLRDERQKLLAIQQELQTLHDRFTVSGVEVEEGNSTEKKSAKPKKQVVQEDTQPAQEESGSDRPQRPSQPVVTFSSNDEVYGKMRKQRMLREELRQKKRELEAIMKKDNSRKQYGKNQDNQSDTVSYTTDAFGASASADATMATWGGSTVDNLESITEDENGQQATNNMEEDDDGYPSDGILQVEEEEEENDSDNNTYTIENDVRQRRQAREQQRKKLKTQKQTFPRSRDSKDGGATRPKQPSAWTKPYRASRMKQENYRAPEDIIQDHEDSSASPGGAYEVLQQQLEKTASLCQSLLGSQSAAALQTSLSSSGFGLRAPGPDLIQQQVQQQQLMLSLNQCLQQITMQQMEMQNMQRQMQNLSLMVEPPDFPSLPDDSRFRSQTSLPTGFDSRGMSPNIGGVRGDAFTFQPRFPASFIHSRSNENLLLDEATGGQDISDVFGNDRLSATEQSSKDQHRKGIRSKSCSSGQFTSRPMKRKTSHFSDRSRRQNSQQQTSITESPDIVPPINLQEILRKKKNQSQNTQSEWSTMSLASSKHESGADGSPNMSRSTSSRTQTKASRNYRPGLSAGISGTGFHLENSSIASTVSNRLQAEASGRLSQRQETRMSIEPGDFSLFETLRESIYSEVATLISQNENRPHFLIELFRELQVLTTDYLRQRVLYSIRDIVSKHLTEQTTGSSIAAPPPVWMNANALYNYTASELTPSESFLTSDEEEIKVKGREVPSSKVDNRPPMARGSSLKNDQFDYVENADNDSTLSTPSNSYWDNPFSQDSLGDTVIYLDKALKRVKEYDKKIAEREARARTLTQQRESREEAQRAISEPTSSSAVDQGSESSVSSMSYPKIDTKQLDQQIKSIMKEVIPVLKEHMDHVCTSQLLAYIKRLVMSLARQGEDNQYNRFFSVQMSSTLQDTLAKYEGRKMSQCGEDLLVDMSEVLFNELAFYKLMEGLGEPPSVSNEEFCSTATQTREMEDVQMNNGEETEESDTETTETISEEGVGDLNSSVRINAKEEEDLGKARDDELANEVQIKDAEDKDEDPESPYKASPVQIELAPSETKPFTRIGSDEDDEDADESQSADDPSDTAVSHTAMMERSLEQDGTIDSMPEEEVIPNQNDADQGAQKESSSKVQLNGLVEENGNEITVDDLPETLNISKELLQNKINQEQQSNGEVEAILSSMDGQEELAGDGQFLKEPSN